MPAIPINAAIIAGSRPFAVGVTPLVDGVAVGEAAGRSADIIYADECVVSQSIMSQAGNVANVITKVPLLLYIVVTSVDAQEGAIYEHKYITN
jgi:hypothetical protein